MPEISPPENNKILHESEKELLLQATQARAVIIDSTGKLVIIVGYVEDTVKSLPYVKIPKSHSEVTDFQEKRDQVISQLQQEVAQLLQISLSQDSVYIDFSDSDVDPTFEGEDRTIFYMFRINEVTSIREVSERHTSAKFIKFNKARMLKHGNSFVVNHAKKIIT